MARTLLRAGRVAVGGIFAALALGLILYTLTRVGRAQVDTGQPPPATAQEETGVDMAAFQRAAADLRRTCRYDDLYDLCVQTLEAPLDAKQVVRVGGELARLYIETQLVDPAEEVTDQLCVDYADQPEVVPVLCEIGDAWRSMRDFDRAKAVYERTVAEQGERPYAMWAQKNLCTLAIQRRQEDEARAAITTLQQRFGTHEQLALALCEIGDRYLDRKDYAEAMEVYRTAVEHYGKQADTIWAQKNICTTLLHKNVRNLEQAQAQTQRLIELFGDRPQAAQALCEVGDAWLRIGQTAKAVELYTYVVEQYPAADAAIWSQKNLCTLYAEQQDAAAAEAAVATLLERFGEHPFVSKAVCEVGDAWRRAGRADQALAYYQQVIDTWPQSQWAVWSAKNIVTLHIEAGDLAAAGEALDGLAADFADREQLPQTLLDIIDAYRAGGYLDAAAGLCDYVEQTFPVSRWALWARQKAILVDIALSEQAQPPPDTLPEPIAQGVDALIADFATFSEVTFAVFMIGEEYYTKADRARVELRKGESHNWGKAIAVWDRIVQGQTPLDRGATPEAWFLTGVCYGRMGESERARPYLETVLRDWPDYQYAWDAQVFIAMGYEGIKYRDRRRPRTDLDDTIERAYQAVLEEFPDCTLVWYAHLRLAHLKHAQSRWAEAAMHAEMFLQDKFVRASGDRAEILIKLGECYDRLGDPGLAEQAYQQCLSEFPNLRENQRILDRLETLKGGAQ